jgi:hypothetical protein
LPQLKSILSVEAMKMRMIKLTPKFLAEALQGKAAAFPSNLSNNIEFLDIKIDLASNQVYAIIRSDSFEDIPESYPIPELNLTFTAKPQAITQPTANVKPEPKPTASVQRAPEVAEKKQTQPNQQVSRIQNEFSPDQLKLLSFKAEGEYVIVKPIQFLKAEWEDINEVVRSLGGKWVKGDILSYWEIPLK